MFERRFTEIRRRVTGLLGQQHLCGEPKCVPWTDALIVESALVGQLPLDGDPAGLCQFREFETNRDAGEFAGIPIVDKGHV